MENLKTIKKIIFDTSPISYGKLYEFLKPLVVLFGLSFKDNSEYRLTQKFDMNNNPTNIFFLSNRSLDKTTYKEVSIENIQKLNLLFIRSEMNHGIYHYAKKSKYIKYFGKSKQVVNSPYMIDLNFGDYIVLSNDLMIIVPKKKFKLLFK